MFLPYGYKLNSPPFDYIPLPNALNVTLVASYNIQPIQQVFNSDIANNPVSVNYAEGNTQAFYGDGFKGNGYNKLFIAKRGLKCYGFTISCVYNSGINSGQPSTFSMLNSNPTLLIVNNIGQNYIPKGIPLCVGLRNTQYNSGMMTVKLPFTLSPLSVFQITGVETYVTTTITILTNPF